MVLIKTVPPDQAEGDVKEVYSFFESMGAEVPLNIQMISASPDILKMQAQALQYFMGHPTLGFPLLAHIRLLVSKEENYQYCIDLNSNLLLTLGGLSQEQLADLMADPNKAVLEDKDKAMLLFVIKAVQDPATTQQQEIDQLRELGWTDRDIYDATLHGMNMVCLGMMFKAFKGGEV